MDTEIFKVTDDATEIEEILNKKHLCFLLNPQLTISQMAGSLDKSYVFAVEHEGGIRRAVSCGLYKQKQKSLEELDTEITGINQWLKEGNNPILETLLESPLSIILSEKLSPKQMFMLKKAFEIIIVQHKNRQREAIACVYYDPNTKLKGQILSQEFIGVS